MSLGWIIVLGILVLILVIGIFTMVNDPKEVDEEESEQVEKEIDVKKKKRWWSR